MRRKAERSRSRSPALPPINLGPPEYNDFLNNFIKGKKVSGNGKLTKLIQQNVDKVNEWPYPYTHDSGQDRIIKEVLNKFNNHNKLGIKKLYPAKGEDLAAYSFSGDMVKPKSKTDYSYLSLQQTPPDPLTIAHEVVHANDHQIDHLMPEIWQYLQEPRNDSSDDNNFEQSLRNIQNKIDPRFFGGSDAYSPKTVKDQVTAEINQYRNEIKKKNLASLPTSYPWDEGLHRMSKLVNRQTPRSEYNDPKYNTANAGVGPNIGVPNYHYKGTYASEFPAYGITQSFHPWNTNKDSFIIDEKTQSI